MLYEFGAFRLDLKQRELKRNGEPVALTPRAFDFLVLLVQNSGTAVTRDQLMKTIWPDTIVEDGNLSQIVFILRTALGTDENGRSFIQTIPRLGYKFVAPVELADAPVSESGSSAPPESSIAGSYWSQHSPFRGLRAFEPKDYWLFFGRDSETRELCGRLGGSTVVAIVGNSGSGKSSLVRAGLIPVLRRTRFRTQELSAAPWRIAVFRPSNSPFDYLAEILPGALTPEMDPEEQAEFTADFRGTLTHGAGALHEAISELREAASEDAQRAPFLLVVDQFEEIFTLTADAGARARYIDALLSAARPDGPFSVHLVLVLRADFYGECLEHAELSRCLERNLYNVPRMMAGRLRETIEKRLALATARAEAGLIESLLEDVGTEPGNLALLEHALGQLWKKCGGYGGLLTNQAYAEIGRVRGALSQHADEVYESLEDESQKQLAQRIFLELVHLGQGAQDTSRRVRKRDLLSLGAPAMVELVLTQLASSRLISIGGEGQQTFVEVSHEALIRNWPALRQWLALNRAELELERRLLQAADEWQGLGHDPGALLHGARLAQGEEWWARHGDASDGLQRFLQASVKARMDEERKELEARELELARQLELRRQAEARASAEKQLREQQELGALQLRQVAALQRRFLWSLAILAVVLLLGNGALWAAYRQSLIKQARIEQSRALAAQALELMTRDPGQARALALRSWRTSETEEAHLAIATTIPEQLAVLKHDGPVVRAVFSPDGRRVLTASDDHTARLWDSASGRPLASLLGHTDKVEHAAFSPDGQRIATASFDHTARLWNSAGGRLLATLKGHSDAVLRVAFSPDGKRVLTASRDHTARLWNSTDGQLLLILKHDDVITKAEFSPEGRRIITASWDKTAQIWDSSDGRLLTTLRGHTGPLIYAEFSPDGRRIITTSTDHTACVWDSSDGRLLNKLQHESLVGMARFSPDGNYILTASDDQSARVWSGIDGHLLATLHHDGAVRFAEFSSDGRHISTASLDHKARLWNSADGRLVAVFQGHTGQVMHASISPDNRLFVTASKDGTARLWNMAGGRVLATLKGHTDRVPLAVFSPDGGRIATASADNTARIWNAEDGRLLATLKGHTDEVTHVEFSPDARHIITSSFDSTVRVWNSSDGKLSATLLGHAGRVDDAEFSPDGQRIVTASWDHTARIWDSSNGRLLATLQGHTGTVWRARFSPDGRRVVTACADHSAKVWNSADGNLLFTVQDHASQVNDAEFSPDGQRIVTASSDSTARVWKSADGSLLTTLQGHNGAVWYAKFSPDGRRIVTASDDKTAKVWSSADGRLLATLQGHAARLVYAEFSPDGRSIVTASSDSTARVWNSADGALLARLEGHTDAVWQSTFSPDGQRIVTASFDHTARVWKLLTLSDIEELFAK